MRHLMASAAPEVEVVVEVRRVGRGQLQEELPGVVDETALHFVDGHRHGGMFAENGDNALFAFALGHNLANAIGDVNQRDGASSCHSDFFVMGDK